jgi:L-serine/L-threonine ammonia-lyase
MIAKIRAAGAHEVIQHGATWKEADAYMREVLLAEDKNGVHVPPFDHEDIWHGNSTLVEEVKEQLNHSRSPVSRSEGIKPTGAMTNGYSTSRREIVPDAIICSVGGGGLFAGIMEALSRNPTWSHVPVIAVETQGAASLHSSLKAKSLITLPSITSLATSLGASRVAEKAFEYAQQPNVRSVMLSDAEAAMGCWRIADDERMMVELACGVSAALCYGGRLEKALGKKLTGDEVIVVVLCGGNNVTVDMLARFREEYAYVEKMEKISGEVPSEYSRPAKA